MTTRFEDAEIAREERKALAAILMYHYTGVDLDSASSGTEDAIDAFRVADMVLSCGFSRQSPASTTAAAPEGGDSR